MTLENILIDCKKQLTGALNHKKHPFRYFTLASLSKDDNTLDTELSLGIA